MQTYSQTELLKAESDISEMRRIAYEAGIPVPAVHFPNAVMFRNWLFLVLSRHLQRAIGGNH